MATKKITGDDIVKEGLKWINKTHYSHDNQELLFCDCVGFVRLLFQKLCGYTWNKDARGYKGISAGAKALYVYFGDRPNQYTWLDKMPPSKLKIGDIMFFISPGKIPHTGLYAGKRKILHSSNGSKNRITYRGKSYGTVELRDLTSAGQIPGYGTYIGAFRVNALGTGAGINIDDIDSDKPKQDNFNALPKGAKETVIYLRSKGFNAASAIGIAANIKSESNFNPGAIGDGGTSFGICQWHLGRGSRMKAYVGKNWATNLNGQLDFLVHEMQQSYRSTVYNPVRNVPNTLEGAKQAADIFVRKFEVPAFVDEQSRRRQETAKSYWTGSTIGTETNASAFISESGTAVDFNTSTSKLSSSDNYTYVEQEDTSTQQSATQETLAKTFKTLVDQDAIKRGANSLAKPVSQNTLAEIEKYVASINGKEIAPVAEFKSVNTYTGSTLPIYMTYVEAPFGEVTLGGVTFGTANFAKNYSSYPNYIQSITINKTNGTVNEYTINLIHQVAPGDNPNYIAELLSATGYNEITISYGDGAYRTYFNDIKALVTDVKTSFNFTNSLISYTITATSLAYLTATTKRNFPAQKDKPSNIILNLLQDSSLQLTEYFTGMTDITHVTSSGLIPSNDRVVDVEEVKNKTIIEYLSYLTSLMENEDNDVAKNSTYYLVINDETGNEGTTFSIKEIISDKIKPNEFIYEVDVGYPDANMVFDFNISTNYAWAATYDTANKITTYNYNIDDVGNIQRTAGSALISSAASHNQFKIDSNTWKQLTRFPINATLTVKELLSPLLLLSYIKVNNYYFGNKRITSGLYIVTEQTDTISGSGCRTSLGLTRVASDAELLTADGRILT